MKSYSENLNHETNKKYSRNSCSKTRDRNNDTGAMKNFENRLRTLLAADGAASQTGRSFNKTCQWKKLSFIFLIFISGVNMNACSMFGSSMSWKEEVLLHDGTKMIVSRSQTRSGAGEIGQGSPITEHSITFTPVGSSQSVIWKSESSANIRHANLNLLALDVVNGTPYIATSPRGCLVYEKWNRPNPPYIFFKYVDQRWMQVSVKEFPLEIQQPNVVIDMYSIEEIKNKEKNLASSRLLISRKSMAAYGKKNTKPSSVNPWFARENRRRLWTATVLPLVSKLHIPFPRETLLNQRSNLHKPNEPFNKLTKEV